MLNEFVEKILVHERARKGSQDTTQEVEIYFNFVGRYIPPALQPVPLTPEEQEELRKKEERKDRLHQNYLRRKANGKQKGMGRTLQRQAQGPRWRQQRPRSGPRTWKRAFLSPSASYPGRSRARPLYRPAPQFNRHSAKEDEHEQIDLHPLRRLLHPRPETFEQPEAPIGKYGRMRQRYLKNTGPAFTAA